MRSALLLAALLCLAAPLRADDQGCSARAKADRERTRKAAKDATQKVRGEPLAEERLIEDLSYPCDPQQQKAYPQKFKEGVKAIGSGADVDNDRRYAVHDLLDGARSTEWGRTDEGRKAIRDARSEVFGDLSRRETDRSEALLGQHRWEEARREAEKAERDAQQAEMAEIKRAKNQLLMAQAFMGLRNFPLAEKSASRALAADPNLGDAYSTRAAARMALGDAKGAQADAQAALARNAGDKSAQAITQASKAEESGPAVAAAPLQIKGWQTAQPGMLEAALPDSARVGATMGANSAPRTGDAPPGGLSGVAAGKLQIGDLDGALLAADQAVARDPGDAQGWLVRANVKNLRSVYEAALADADRSLALRPTAEAYQARSWALHGLGRDQEALEAAEAAVKAAPRDALSYLNRARALEALGKKEDALLDYKRAAHLNPQFKKVLEDAYARAALPSGAAPQSGGLSKALGGNRLLVGVLLAGILASAAAWGLRSKGGSAATGGWGRTGTRGTPGPAAGDVLAGKYALEEEIGRGGMGVVYRGKDTVLERAVAVKRMRGELGASPVERQRFLQEARLVASLQHPAIVSIHDIFDEGGDVYLVFELVRGQTLEALLGSKGRLPLKDCKRLLVPVCEALAYAHARRIIHRDLKPSNIMVSPEGLVKVMDFGIARQAKETVSRLTATGAIGTPAYMPPEQENGQVCQESDLYALGCCLYEMACGRPPFQSGNVSAQKAQQSYPRPSTLQRDLPPELDAFIQKALQPDPKRRFQNPQDFQAALLSLPDAVARA